MITEIDKVAKNLRGGEYPKQLSQTYSVKFEICIH